MVMAMADKRTQNVLRLFGFELIGISIEPPVLQIMEYNVSTKLSLIGQRN